MKKFLRIVFTALCIFLIFICGDNKVVSAEDENSIFNLDVDGYWKPTDIKSHDFFIKNGFGEICYINGFSFKKTTITDIETGKEYSLDEADKEGIIDSYNIMFLLKDDKYGESILYNGKLKNLNDYDIKLQKGLCMGIGQKIKFSMTISMDTDAKNKYKNKYYEFSIVPTCHKVIYDTSSDESLKNDNYSDCSDENCNDKVYVDNDGNYRVDGYYDKDGNWHSGYYYKDGIKYEENKLSGSVNRVHKYFKTGQGMVAIVGYEIMFIICCFFIMYRIRQRQNALYKKR